MNGLTMMILAVVVLGGAYLIYGRYLAKKWGINPDSKTPAYEMEDGVDYVPADTNVVFGHQFASIAGAGPINGPIQAAMFGWLPVMLWILLGGVFFGAVQDFASMYASVKNKGRSIGYIIELYIGKLGKRLFLLFTWLFSILVVAAFADIVAGTFNGFDANGATVTANGAVATTSLLFIVFAVGLGFYLKYTRFPKMLNTLFAIALLVLAVGLGLAFPIYVPQSAWLIFVFIYVIIACVTPVWALLQPRDYLNSYLLIAMIVGSVLGICVYNPSMNLPSFTAFKLTAANGSVSYLFPALFVTIACGAVSGFHSLVASGTASKQIKNEKNMLPVSFGAMLLESLLAITALIAAGFVATQEGLPAGTPPQLFAQAISIFLTSLGLPESVCYTLITLAISAFALTSLDSVARVGRIAFQEFFTDDSIAPEDQSPLNKVLTNKYFATILTLVLCYALSRAGYASIWPLFGSANQLLSALALIACAVFLKKTKRQGAMLWGPMVIMLGVTFTALALKITELVTALSGQFVFGNALQLVFAVLLLILGVIVAFEGIKKLIGKDETSENTETSDAKKSAGEVVA
ncbi:MAG: carbon starvation protein A [Hungatella sp.]|uniref:Carbon starvation protein A n=1 Tax=Hungatella hathewayi TaxID=154046 RepID=A0A374PB56_9FIRM|nr:MULTISPECIES: carbon starvation protein A [Hungatella]MBC5702068.1 carbon starvation protein A [Hungatella sp. L36]MBS5240754.1 carbon starvation protein A [Hungatella hathewayi]MDU0928333.1 carbon starvation protein A [Hungatella hathewayi]RGJ05496.1 carbon starvation protein A [Hungatella hathewayi]RGK90263.1 carbon starvation protein A [Hungatella hathewayi]